MTIVLALVASNAVIAAILALVTLAVTSFWRSPQLAHGLWLLVLIKLITPPFVTMSLPGEWLAVSPEPMEFLSPAVGNVSRDGEHGDSLPPLESDFKHAASMATNEVAMAESPLVPDRGDRAAGAADRVFDSPSALWLTAIGIVWMAGSLAFIGLLAWRCVNFRRLLATSDAADREITESAARLAAKLGLRRRPAVRTVDAPIPPLVWSFGLRPIVVLPATLFAELSPDQRDTLVAHELAHIRRRDDLVRWLEAFALVLWWWNPVAWFARRKLREAEEECCDAWVVWALPGQRRSYCEAMLAAIEFLSAAPKFPALAASAFGGSFYKRRI